jgi:glycosyltransferase involved in cell wall biosynthesis
MRVSVITVSLNAAACIETALQSVQAQTYPHIDHVIVDGGSTDGTLEIINRHRQKLGQVISEADRGVYHAMNKGVRLATGDILFFLNTDDRFVDDQVVADVVSVFTQHPKVQVVYGNLIWESPEIRVRKEQQPVITRELLARRTVLHQTVFAKREVFALTGGFSEQYRIVGDYEWLVRVFLRDRHNYVYYNRDIAFMGTGGLSRTTKWEGERLQAMLQHFSLYEIVKYRIWPRQKAALEERLKKGRSSTREMMRGVLRRSSVNEKRY